MINELKISRFFTIVGALLLISFLIWDSRLHFDREWIELKKKYRSGQKNWSIFYSQRNVYTNGAIAQLNDLNYISSKIASGSTVLSDKATTYYLASVSKGYFKNVHYHHGNYLSRDWYEKLLKNNRPCYIHKQKNWELLMDIVMKDYVQSQSNDMTAMPKVYFVTNGFRKNTNLSRDCLSSRSIIINDVLFQRAEHLASSGDLELFELSSLPVE